MGRFSNGWAESGGWIAVRPGNPSWTWIGSIDIEDPRTRGLIPCKMYYVRQLRRIILACCQGWKYGSRRRLSLILSPPTRTLSSVDEFSIAWCDKVQGLSGLVRKSSLTITFSLSQYYPSTVTTYHWFRFNRHHFQELCLMYQQSDGKINMTRTNKAVSSCHPLFCQQQYKNRAKACVHKFGPLFQQTSTDCPYRTHTSGI